MSTTIKLLLAASGVDAAKAHKHDEVVRYSCFGALVLFTSVLAFGSWFLVIGYALSVPLAARLAVAALWATGIFFFDRLIVSSTLERNGLWYRFRTVALRSLLAIPVGLSVAWFVTLIVFSPEIDQQLSATHAVQVQQIRAATEHSSAPASELSTLSTQKKTLAAAVTTAGQQLAQAKDALATALATETTAQAAYDAEIAGTGGSHIPGDGPDAKTKHATVVADQTELKAAESVVATDEKALSDATAAQQTGDARLATEVAAAQASLDQQVAKQAAAVNADNGILARSEALSQVLHQDSGADNLAHLLEALFIVADLFPAIAKAVFGQSRVDVERTMESAKLTFRTDLELETFRTSPDLRDAVAYKVAAEARRLREEVDEADRPDVPGTPGRAGADPRRGRASVDGRWVAPWPDAAPALTARHEPMPPTP